MEIINSTGIHLKALKHTRLHTLQHIQLYRNPAGDERLFCTDEAIASEFITNYPCSIPKTRKRTIKIDKRKLSKCFFLNIFFYIVASLVCRNVTRGNKVEVFLKKGIK